MHGLREVQMAFVSTHLDQTLPVLNTQELVNVGMHFQSYVLANGNRHKSGLQVIARPYRGAERVIVQRGFIYIHNERIWPVVCRSALIMTVLLRLRRHRGHICVIFSTLVMLEYMKHLFQIFFRIFRTMLYCMKSFSVRLLSFCKGFYANKESIFQMT